MALMTTRTVHHPINFYRYWFRLDMLNNVEDNFMCYNIHFVVLNAKIQYESAK